MCAGGVCVWREGGREGGRERGRERERCMCCCLVCGCACVCVCVCVCMMCAAGWCGWAMAACLSAGCPVCRRRPAPPRSPCAARPTPPVHPLIPPRTAGPRGRGVPRPGRLDPHVHHVHRWLRLLLLRPHHRRGAAGRLLCVCGECVCCCVWLCVWRECVCVAVAVRLGDRAQVQGRGGARVGGGNRRGRCPLLGGWGTRIRQACLCLPPPHPCLLPPLTAVLPPSPCTAPPGTAVQQGHLEVGAVPRAHPQRVTWVFVHAGAALPYHFFGAASCLGRAGDEGAFASLPAIPGSPAQPSPARPGPAQPSRPLTLSEARNETNVATARTTPQPPTAAAAGGAAGSSHSRWTSLQMRLHRRLAASPSSSRRFPFAPLLFLAQLAPC